MQRRLRNMSRYPGTTTGLKLYEALEKRKHVDMDYLHNYAQVTGHLNRIYTPLQYHRNPRMRMRRRDQGNSRSLFTHSRGKCNTLVILS